MKSKIVGVGHYVPDNVVTNADLEKMMDTSSDWIIERTGIQERRWVVPGQDTNSGMAIKASHMALERAGLSPSDIDFIVFATLSPEYFFPGPGVTLQHEMGMDTVGALDIRAQCSGFIYGLSVADQYIKSGMYKNILVVGSEVQNIVLDKTTRGRGTAVLFGDGAGAAVLQPSRDGQSGILSTHLHSQGEHRDLLCLKEPGATGERFINQGLEQSMDIYPIMDGPAVFKHAVTRFDEVIRESLEANGMQPSDIDLFVPHQANLRISQMVQRKLRLRDDQVFNNIQRYGNTTAATIPIALSELWEQVRLQPGKIISLAAFGSGFTWASALIRW